MKKNEIDIIKNFAQSTQWEIIKDKLFTPYLNSLRDVSTPLNLDDVKVEPSEAFLAKQLASRKLDEVIKSIDSLSQKSKTTIKNEEFI